MSAITYSGLRNYGKTSLPSVESWSQNMNILKDPPKSIHTRRIDKTGTTSSRTVMIDESGDRASGCINVYARGVNPMVSVSYNNNGIHYENSSVENNSDIKLLFASLLILSKCKYIICSSGNCSLWTIFYRGNAHNIFQFYNGSWYT